MGKSKERFKLFYFHIPKTGGQTLATRLASAFPIGKSSIMGDGLYYPKGEAELYKLFEDHQFVERHVVGPVLQNIRNIDFLVTIRDPIKQIVSNYLHVLRQPENNLYRPAKALTPLDFFLRFGDLLANSQAKYLVTAFYDNQPIPDPVTYYMSRSIEALDRIRWIVPTRSIDEFTTLWSLETQITVPQNQILTNVAPKDDAYEELLNIVRSMPELYAIDLCLWQAAIERYEYYREDILSRQIPFNSPNNTTRAYYKDGEGIWLQKGWHPPQQTPVGLAWWAGPGQYSKVMYQRKENSRYLRLTVVVLCGVESKGIKLVKPDMIKDLPVAKIQQGEFLTFWVDLAELPKKGYFWFYVPCVMSPIMVDHVTDDVTRQSFATTDWRFDECIPA